MLLASTFLGTFQARDLLASDYEGIVARLVKPVPSAQIQLLSDWLGTEISQPADDRSCPATFPPQKPQIDDSIGGRQPQVHILQRRGGASLVFLLALARIHDFQFDGLTHVVGVSIFHEAHSELDIFWICGAERVHANQKQYNAEDKDSVH
ncbi:MAG TPA: hypothetical protein VJK29_11020 [Terriglobales bacterium]|nr:hypothetical protein [Terriglobales bacterium]